MRAILMLLAATVAAFSVPAAAQESASAAVKVAEEMKPLPPGRVEIRVGDLHCKTCAKKVARKLYAVKGVRKVTSSLKDDLVVALLPADKPVSPEQLWQAVEAGGVKPVELRYADQAIDVEQMKTRLATKSTTAG